jgi:hypothetical protein
MKRVLLLSLLVLLLSGFSSFAWLHYKKTAALMKEQPTCCKQIKSNETIFEVMVKRLIGIA